MVGKEENGIGQSQAPESKKKDFKGLIPLTNYFKHVFAEYASMKWTCEFAQTSSN